MSDVIKVAAAGMIAAVCALVLQKHVPELAILLAVCAGILILLYCSGALKTVVGFFRELVELGGLNAEIVAPVIKVTGIAIVTRLSSEFCKDAKEMALAAVVELAGSILALLATIPLLAAVLEMLGTMV